MSDDPKKDAESAPKPPAEGAEEVPKPEPTLPGVGNPASVRELTVLGVGGPPRERTVIGVGVDPNAPPDELAMTKPRSPTMLGVGEEQTPAQLQLTLESSVSDLQQRVEAALAEAKLPPSAPAPAPAAPPPPPSSKPAAPPPVPAKREPPPAPPPAPRAASERSVSDLHPAGVPRSGIATKLIVVALLAGGVVAYLERDKIMEQISPTAPSASVRPEPAPFDGASDDGSALLAAQAASESDLDASASKDATAKDSGAKDAGAKDAGAKDAGAKDAGAATKTDGGAAQHGASAKPLPKPAPKPAPHAP